MSQEFLPFITTKIRQALDDDTVDIGDPDLAISQNSIAVATYTAAAKLITDSVVTDLKFAASIRSASGKGASA